LWYKLNPEQEKLTGKDVKYSYFTPPLLTDYQDMYGEIDNLYYGVRGFLRHPHGEKPIFLDTKAVREYGLPDYEFNKLIYIEKNGPLPVLEDIQFMERYDAALLVAQGFGTRDMKRLIDKIWEHNPEMLFFCVHDCDVYGINIYRTLQEATRTAPARQAQIIDMGLRPAQVWDMGLKPEEVSYQKKPPEGIIDLLTFEEYEWLLQEDDPWGGHRWTGNRVELNQLAPKEMGIWLESQLELHEATGKVIPPDEEIEKQFTEIAEKELLEEFEEKVTVQLEELFGVSLKEINQQALEQVKDRIAVGDCRKEMQADFEDNPSQSWRTYTDEKAKEHIKEITDGEEMEEIVRKILEDANPELWR